MNEPPFHSNDLLERIHERLLALYEADRAALLVVDEAHLIPGKPTFEEIRLLTNFQPIRKSVDRLKTIRTWREDGTLERFTKKEAAQFESEISRLEKVLGGIIEMPRLPKAMYVVDAKREETAVREAVRLGIPVVALVDTNSDPDPIAYPIPGNDDAIRSIKLVTARLADAILEGRQTHLAEEAKQKAEEEAQKAKAEAEAEAEEEAKKQKKAAEAVPTPSEPDKQVLTPEALQIPTPDEKKLEQIVPDEVLKSKVEISEPPKKKAKKPKAERQKKKEPGSPAK